MAAENVIPELPPQSLNLVPLIVPTAPAIVISLKSISVNPLIALMVNVLGVPIVSDFKHCLYVESIGDVNVNVPLILWSLSNEKLLRPANPEPLDDIVKLLKVLFPVIVA